MVSQDGQLGSGIASKIGSGGRDDRRRQRQRQRLFNAGDVFVIVKLLCSRNGQNHDQSVTEASCANDGHYSAVRVTLLVSRDECKAGIEKNMWAPARRIQRWPQAGRQASRQWKRSQ